MAWKLSELFIQFTSQGLDVLKNNLSDLKSKMADLGAAADAAGIGITKTFSKITADLTTIVKGVEAAGGGAIEQMNDLQKSVGKLDLKARPEISLVGVDKAQKELEKLSEGLFARRQFVGLTLGASGSAELNKALAQTKANLAEVRAELLKQLPASFLERLEGVGKAAAKGFALLTGSILGFVTAGLVGTTMGERLSLQVQLLSQQIAALFLPIIEMVSEKLQALIDWFRGLSGEQQDSLMKWTLWTAGALAAIAIIPKIIAAVRLMIAAWNALAVSIAFVKALTGVGLAQIAIAATAAAAVAGGLYLATHPPDEEEKTKGGRRELARSGGSYSSIEDSFRQLQLAALRQDVGATIEQKQLTAQERTAAATEATRDKLDRLKPAVGK